MQVPQALSRRGPAAVPPLLGQQLVQGIQQDGWAPGVSTVEQVFEFIDPDGLYVNSVIDSLTGEILDADIILTDGWIRHYWMQYNELLPQIAMHLRQQLRRR